MKSEIFNVHLGNFSQALRWKDEQNDKKTWNLIRIIQVSVKNRYYDDLSFLNVAKLQEDQIKNSLSQTKLCAKIETSIQCIVVNIFHSKVIYLGIKRTTSNVAVPA